MSRKGKYSYYVEDKALEVTDRPRKFLEAFAAVLEHANYGLALDTYTRLSTKCSRCAASCQLYETTGETGRHPLPSLRAAAAGLPAVLHASRGSQGQALRRLHADRRVPGRNGRGVLPLHGLPALQDRPARWASTTA